MKKKQRETAIEKKKAPKGKDRGSKSDRERKTEDKEVKEKEKVVKEEVKEKKIKKEKEEKAPKKTKEEKQVKEIEKIKFPPKEEKVERKKKPLFFREGFYKRKNLKENWRRPRGGDSKKRMEKRGKGKVPKIGYKNPEKKRGLIKGLKPRHIYNPSQLDSISDKREGAIISSSVGRKKRNEIIKKANELKITILNPRKGELEK